MAPKPTPARAKVEIDCETLARLLARRQMQVCELKCLDTESKQLLRKLCLDTCMQACGKSRA